MRELSFFSRIDISMGRSSKEEGFNRGARTAAEDKILTDYITIYGEGKWRYLPKRAGN